MISSFLYSSGPFIVPPIEWCKLPATVALKLIGTGGIHQFGSVWSSSGCRDSAGIVGWRVPAQQRDHCYARKRHMCALNPVCAKRRIDKRKLCFKSRPYLLRFGNFLGRKEQETERTAGHEYANSIGWLLYAHESHCRPYSVGSARKYHWPEGQPFAGGVHLKSSSFNTTVGFREGSWRGRRQDCAESGGQGGRTGGNNAHIS